MLLEQNYRFFSTRNILYIKNCFIFKEWKIILVWTMAWPIIYIARISKWRRLSFWTGIVLIFRYVRYVISGWLSVYFNKISDTFWRDHEGFKRRKEELLVIVNSKSGDPGFKLHTIFSVNDNDSRSRFLGSFQWKTNGSSVSEDPFHTKAQPPKKHNYCVALGLRAISSLALYI